MPRLRLGVLAFDLFWLGFLADLIAEYENTSGFKAAGILVAKNACPCLYIWLLKTRVLASPVVLGNTRFVTKIATPSYT